MAIIIISIIMTLFKRVLKTERSGTKLHLHRVVDFVGRDLGNGLCGMEVGALGYLAVCSF